MAEKLDSKETVSFEELLMSNVIEQKALVNLVEKKGITSKFELLEEIKKLRERKKDIKRFAILLIWGFYSFLLSPPFTRRRKPLHVPLFLFISLPLADVLKPLSRN